jgi:hypothetical protein
MAFGDLAQALAMLAVSPDGGDVIAAEIVEDLQAALDEFALVAEDLRKT